MEEPNLAPGLAATQVVAETPAASQAPPPPPAAAQDPPPPPAEAQAPPAPPAAAQARPDPPATDQSPPPPPAAAAAQVPPPPSTAAQAPPPSSTAAVNQPARGKKRPLDSNFQIENSKYFKMRLVLKDLRPHFLEVLQTPDFRNCKAADEIREKMKLMLELYQQMTGETAKREYAPKSQSLPNGNGIDQTSQNISTRSSETWSYATAAEKHQQPEGGEKSGSHVVGGSAFGWNFITYGGSEPVYYGMTKEEYRNSHPIAEVEQ